MHKKKVFFNVTLHYTVIKKKRERLRGNKKRYLLGTERRKKKTESSNVMGTLTVANQRIAVI
jgi:hypothetical protein